MRSGDGAARAAQTRGLTGAAAGPSNYQLITSIMIVTITIAISIIAATVIAIRIIIIASSRLLQAPYLTQPWTS